jgi:hypothetical protein
MEKNPPISIENEGLAADNRQLGAPEFGSLLALRLRGTALTVSTVCYS